MYIKWLLLGSMLFFFHGCDSNSVYMDTITCADDVWKRAEARTFHITIADPTPTYDVYLLLLYTTDFPYQNIFIKHDVEADNSHETLETALSNHMLCDAKTGKLLGTGCWGKQRYIRFPLLRAYSFPRQGEYSVTLTQFMRTESLSGIEKVGLQVCKSNTIKE